MKTQDHPTGDLKLSALLDIPVFQDLSDSFHNLTGIPIGILDLRGNILIASGWQRICTEFHRKHPVAASKCLESDTRLAKGLAKDRKFNISRCQNGLMDAAAPITIDGTRLGSLFTGQFLLNKPDIEFFSGQAETYGFDREAYLGALADVPVFSDRQIKKALDYLANLTMVITSTGIDKKNLQALNRNLEKEVRQRTLNMEMEKQFSDSLIASLPGVMYMLDPSGHLCRWNLNFEEITGYSNQEIPDTASLDFISEKDRPLVWKTLRTVFKKGKASVEAGLVTKTGETIPHLFTGLRFTQADETFLIGIGIDISERVTSENEKQGLIKELQKSLSQVKQLSGLLPICASCKKIRDDKGYWNQIESYIHEHSQAKFSHGICPECSQKLYGSQDWYSDKQNKNRF